MNSNDVTIVRFMQLPFLGPSRPDFRTDLFPDDVARAKCSSDAAKCDRVLFYRAGHSFQIPLVLGMNLTSFQLLPACRLSLGDPIAQGDPFAGVLRLRP